MTGKNRLRLRRFTREPAEKFVGSIGVVSQLLLIRGTDLYVFVITKDTYIHITYVNTSIIYKHVRKSQLDEYANIFGF